MSPARRPPPGRAVTLLLLVSAAWGVGPAAGTTPHPSIRINGDAELAAVAALEGWPGDGTPADPFIIQGLHIHATAPAGLTIENVTVAFIVRDNTFTAADPATTDAVRLRNVTGGRIASNTATGVRDGVATLDSRHVVVEGNRVEDCSTAFLLEASAAVEVVHNQAHACVTGALLVGSAGNRVGGNDFAGNAGGVLLSASHGNLVQDNVLSDGADVGNVLLTTGVGLVGSHGNAVARNDVSRIGQGVALVGGSSDNHIEANTAFDTHRYGLRLTGAHRNLLESNLVVDSVETVVVFGGQGNELRGNVIVRSQFDGVHVEGGANLVLVGNRIEDHPGRGVLVHQSGQPVVRGNTIQRTECGLRIFNVVSPQIRIEENDISGNAECGVWVTESTNFTMKSNVLRDQPVGLRYWCTHSGRLYDNLFANALNVDAWYGVNTTWAVLPTPGPNIVGGPWVAGNYWSDYLGPDLTGDGLGEVPHPIVGDAPPLCHVPLPWAHVDPFPLVGSVMANLEDGAPNRAP